MKIINVVYSLLISFLFSSALLASDHEPDSGIDSPTHSMLQESLPKAVQEALKSRIIVLNNGRILELFLADSLIQKIQEELPLTPQPVTDTLNEYLKKTKSATVSDRIIGFSFFLDQKDHIYRQSFLGENAK